MDNHIDRFVEIVKESTIIKGSKWDDLILRFEWTFLADNIRDFIKENKTLTDT
jgi:ATP-binding cassette subfamily B (MDR/TAP) protein 1